MRILLNSDPNDGGAPADKNENNSTPVAAPAAPPAAKIVVTSDVDERVADLQSQLDAARDVVARTEKEKRDREQTICELQDELQTVKFPKRNPAPPRETRSALERWFSGEEV